MTNKPGERTSPWRGPGRRLLYVFVGVGYLALCGMCFLAWQASRPPQHASNTVSLSQPASHVPQPGDPPPNLTDNMPGPQAALTLGNWYYDQEQWGKAIGFYQQAIGHGLDNADVRTDMGNAYRFSDEPQKALEEYRHAQKEDPSHEQSLFNQGGLFAYSMNDPKRGVQAWKAYLRKFPKGQSAAAARNFISKFSTTRARKVK